MKIFCNIFQFFRSSISTSVCRTTIPVRINEFEEGLRITGIWIWIKKNFLGFPSWFYFLCTYDVINALINLRVCNLQNGVHQEHVVTISRTDVFLTIKPLE